MEESKRLKVAVVGLGVGRSHIEAFKNQLGNQWDVVALCDIDETKAREVAGQFDIPGVFTSYEEVCNLPDLDVIDICTPPFLHYDQITKGLAAGKHVICEKPLVSSLKEIDELDTAQKQAGKILLPIFQYRFGHGLQKLKLLVDKGLAGKPYLSTVETSWRRREAYYAVPWRGKWETELGGTLFGHAIHTLDMLTYITGPAKEVYARTATIVHPNIQVEDTASISLKMADGSLASVSVTVGSSVEITRHRFCFSNMVAESNLRPYTSSGDPWTFNGDMPEDEAKIEEALSGFESLPESRAGQFYRFYRSLVHGEPLPVTLADARASLELVTAIYYSSYTNQNISLPIPNDHPFYGGWISHFSQMAEV